MTVLLEMPLARRQIFEIPEDLSELRIARRRQLRMTLSHDPVLPDIDVYRYSGILECALSPTGVSAIPIWTIDGVHP